MSGTRLSDHTLKYEDEDTFEATGMMSGEYAATGVQSHWPGSSCGHV